MAEKLRTLITSALPYSNGYLHLGHLAGAYLPADIYARFKRLQAEELLYICGSDEHGVAITIAADKEKSSPKQIIDKYHYANYEAFQKFGMTFDMYSRTSLPEHRETAREFFSDFLKKGYLLEKEEEQFFDPKAEIFLPDRYIEGICPNCGYDKARGDQCDSCGAYYNQIDLKEPKSLVTGEKPVVRKTTHWYMQFDKFQEFLENYINSKERRWKENVVQQSKSWLKQGLSERAITRDLSWGISIEGIEGIAAEKAKGKSIYVWFEAVLGYITATKLWAAEQEKRGLGAAEDWKKWWKDAASRYIAFIGKDNIVFHTLIFPAMLHARDDGYILPENVPANEFLNLEGQKFSKSRNWSIDLIDFVKDFPKEYSIDSLRYTLAMNLPETRDSDFYWKDYQSRNNNELSAIFGNFVNRTLEFLRANFNLQVPNLPEKYKNLAEDWKYFAENYDDLKSDQQKFEQYKKSFIEKYSENDFQLLSTLLANIGLVSKHYENFRFRDAITETMNISRAANKYFNDEEPWKSVKQDREKAAKSLYMSVQLCNSLGILFAPLLPFSAQKISSFFGNNFETGAPNYDSEKTNYWAKAKQPLLEEGFRVVIPNQQSEKPFVLFPRVEDSQIKGQIEKLSVQTEEQEPLISFDDFMKVKFRTAKILDAEKVKKSKKLIKLQVDLGNEKRQIVAGIAEHYSPEELIGKTIVVVANLQPAKLMGVESNGMLLAANSPDGKLALITVEGDKIEVGAEVR